jgi:hypothetical protein
MPNMKSVPEVKVAILDDGINPEKVRYRVAGGMSFPVYNENMGDFFAGGGRQGNLVANLISSLWPKAHLYIARIDEHMEAKSINKFSIRSVIQVSSLMVSMRLN